MFDNFGNVAYHCLLGRLQKKNSYVFIVQMLFCEIQFKMLLRNLVWIVSNYLGLIEQDCVNFAQNVGKIGKNIFMQQP